MRYIIEIICKNKLTFLCKNLKKKKIVTRLGPSLCCMRGSQCHNATMKQLTYHFFP